MKITGVKDLTNVIPVWSFKNFLYRLYIWWGNKFGGSKEYLREINLGENNLGDKGKHKYFNSEKSKKQSIRCKF